MFSPSAFDLPLDLKSDFNAEFSTLARPGARASTSATSHFWQVPDQHKYLTALTVNPMDNMCAVSSGANENNLFIYEFNHNGAEPQLTHHQTISLPSIHSMQWIPRNTGIGGQGNILVSGHRNGRMCLTMLPDTSSDQPAEILRRFNHLPHINSNSTASTRVRQVELAIDGASLRHIGSLCSEYMFLWDPSRWDLPRLRFKSRGINCFDLNSIRPQMAVLGGSKGISMIDFRKPDSSLTPPEGNSTAVTRVKWSPNDENLVAAVDTDNLIKIWDIRYAKPVSTYDGHLDTITSVEWAADSYSELVSASYDGSIRVWDMHDHTETSPRVSVPATSRKWAQTESWRNFQDRKSGAIDLGDIFTEQRPYISNTNRQFLALELMDHGAYTIDSRGCLGYHQIDSMSSASSASSASDTSDNDFSPPSDDSDHYSM